MGGHHLGQLQSPSHFSPSCDEIRSIGKERCSLAGSSRVLSIREEVTTLETWECSGSWEWGDLVPRSLSSYSAWNPSTWNSADHIQGESSIFKELNLDSPSQTSPGTWLFSDSRPIDPHRPRSLEILLRIIRSFCISRSLHIIRYILYHQIHSMSSDIFYSIRYIPHHQKLYSASLDIFYIIRYILYH